MMKNLRCNYIYYIIVYLKIKKNQNSWKINNNNNNSVFWVCVLINEKQTIKSKINKISFLNQTQLWFLQQFC